MGTISQPYTRVQPLPGGPCSLWKTHWGVDESVSPTTSGFIENSPFRVFGGSHRISTDTIDGKTTKVIECVSSGDFSMSISYFHQTETEAAYGDFIIWLKKTASSAPAIAFIDELPDRLVGGGVDGYLVSPNSLEAVKIRKMVNGSLSDLMVTADGYITANEWHKFCIQRSLANEFTFLIDDVLVDLTGGSGSNPVTDGSTTFSKYFYVDLDAGDKIAYSDINGGHAIVKKKAS